VTSLAGLLGSKVVSRASAEDLGTLTGVVVDAAQHRVTAWQVGKGRKARLVEHGHVTGLGSAAVVVDDEASLREPADGELTHELVGHLVLSDAGFDLGPLVDVDVDAATGSITSVLTEGTRADGTTIRGLGSYALVLRA